MLPPYETIYAYHKDRSPRRNNALLFFFEECVRALTLIRKSWKKNPKRETITERVLRKKNPERSIESICICFCAVDFFPEITLRDGPKKWHIFLFSAAYFPSYWHMPFEISIIR